MAKMLVIQACYQCPHSRDTSACFHPKVMNGDRGRPLRRGPGSSGPPEHQPPPSWCQLPDAPEEKKTGK